MKHLILFSLLSFFTISASAQVGGCSLPCACNYNPGVDFYLPGSCNFDCLGLDVTNAPCISGVGCMDETASNYDPEALYSTPSVCLYPEEDIDFNDDGIIGAADLVVFLTYYGGEWP